MLHIHEGHPYKKESTISVAFHWQWYDVTTRQMADLDWLLYNAPIEYAQLVLSGEMEQYLSGASLHVLED